LYFQLPVLYVKFFFVFANYNCSIKFFFAQFQDADKDAINLNKLQ